MCQTITALGAGQTISVYSNKGGAVVVDILGYITGPTSPAAIDGELVILPTAQRVVDTTVAGQGSATVQVSGHGGVPTGATGVVANMTSITDRRGWAQAVPAGTPASLISQVNSNGGNVPVSAATVTALNPAGQVDLRSYDTNRLQLDIIGYYTTTPPPTPASTGTSYTWDPQSRLATATTPTGVETYSYDTGGQRLAKHRPDGTTTFYVGTEITTDPTGVTIQRYYTIGSTTVATRKVTAGSSEVTWTGSDIQASQTVAVTNNGATTRAYYTPYGQQRGGETPTEHAFLNQITDGGTGFNYLNARYQDPTNGIFTSVDPLNAMTGQPYVYGAGNPAAHSDPSGLCSLGCGVLPDSAEAWPESSSNPSGSTKDTPNTPYTVECKQGSRCFRKVGSNTHYFNEQGVLDQICTGTTTGAGQCWDPPLLQEARENENGTFALFLLALFLLPVAAEAGMACLAALAICGTAIATNGAPAAMAANDYANGAPSPGNPDPIPIGAIDDVVAGATNTAASAGSIDEVLTGLNAGRSAGVRVVSSADKLDGLFTQLSRGGQVVENSYPVQFVQLPDGTTVGIRQTSASGGPTIDIVKPGQQPIKIHVSP